MLVLTRCQGESVLIGDDIQITVLRRRGKRIVLGIAAPKEIVVTRTELMQKENAVKECAVSESCNIAKI